MSILWTVLSHISYYYQSFNIWGAIVTQMLKVSKTPTFSIRIKQSILVFFTAEAASAR